MVLISRQVKVLALASGIATLAVLPGTVFAEGFDRGQALYEHHCQSCHESWAHTRDGRLVTTVGELRRRVEAWSIHSRLDWTAEEIEDVTDYLNRTFYQLEK